MEPDRPLVKVTTRGTGFYGSDFSVSTLSETFVSDGTHKMLARFIDSAGTVHRFTTVRDPGELYGPPNQHGENLE